MEVKPVVQALLVVSCRAGRESVGMCQMIDHRCAL